ncbi:alpha/beta hydrolase [Aquimarina sp. MMG016]|uniref:alpha/beta hydrolase n=1 Tax=Aquimarina sp. MMG016 TaxID=2822690 RepID=UPI001B3A2F46|nr:alpha/beta hydrolase [Aquimarina sp. MMG016]MBQ4822228.1 alpha/beta hydrolase [Aquimarina sp. MMG016]
MKERLKKYIPIIVGKRLLLLFFFAPKKALHKAFVLFCTPRKGDILPEQEYFLEEAEDEVVMIDDIALQTYLWPSMGETILMVHGWESNTHRWKTLIQKLLQEGYNVVAFDAPAQGNSSGKLLNVPLYTESLQKIVELYRPNHIIGHSVGGMTTIFHQYKYPNPEIEKLVVLAPPSELSRIMKDYQGILKLSSKFMNALSDYFKGKFGYDFEEFSIAEFAKKMTHKGLLIHDKHDDIAPFSEAESISKNWKGVKFVATEDFGHSLFFDEVDDMIIDFLKD